MISHNRGWYFELILGCSIDRVEKIEKIWDRSSTSKSEKRESEWYHHRAEQDDAGKESG